MSGKSPAWPWQAWVFRELQASGFNLRAWLPRNTRKVRQQLNSVAAIAVICLLNQPVRTAPLCMQVLHMLDALTKLVDAGTQPALGVDPHMAD